MSGLYAIKCGRLIDGTGADPLENALVIVESERIVESGEGLSVPQGAEVIDAEGKTVMPGLIDGHVHLNADPWKGPLERVLPQDSQTNLRAAKNARTTLEAGYTSILGNCGYGNYADLFLKEAIDAGWLPGPRLWTSGGGITSSLRRAVNVRHGLPFNADVLVDGVEEIRKLVRTHIASGVDWIKVLATFAVGSPNGEPALMNLNQDELSVIVEEAHAQERKVKAHLEGSRTTKEALEAGVDIVLHGFYIDDDDVEHMLRRNVALIPTLAWRGELVRTGAPGQQPWYVEKAKRYGAAHIASFKRAMEGGVLIAAGSDCSGGGSAGDFLRHGENAMELEYLVRQGLTPMEALQAGTRNVAEAYGLSNSLGTIEPGKLADIIIVAGNPLEDIAILQDRNRVEKVMKNGEIVVDNGLSRPGACTPLRSTPPGSRA